MLTRWGAAMEDWLAGEYRIQRSKMWGIRPLGTNRSNLDLRKSPVVGYTLVGFLGSVFHSVKGQWGSNVKSWRVCVADDDYDAASVLVQGLQANNYEAVAVHTGEEALRVCTEGNVDLLLLDVGMPDVDGYDVCRRLKEGQTTRDMPVVFVTVRGSDEDVNRGYTLGAADYIVKPYNLPIVMLRIDAVMRTRQVADHIRSHPDPIFDTAYTDLLTGLRNRRYLMERLQEEVEKAHRYNHPVSCIVLEVDDVNGVEEDMGAAPLDDILVEVAMTLRNESRTYDILARYDGSIFVAVLPYSPLKEAMCYARKILNQIDSITFNDPCFPTEAKVSMGVVSCRNSRAVGADQVLGEAMKNLLKAKSKPEQRLVAVDLNS